MRISILLAGLLLGLPTAALAQTPSDDGAIRAVLGRFRAAIVARDRTAFDGLALSDTITFASAVDPAVRVRVRARRPDATGYEIGSWPAFVDFVAASPAPIEERFSNVVIHNDGTVASLWFDYTFVENGAETNRGHETWSLLRTDAGWRIASVTWSVSDPAP